jgi:hypothetical protein
MSMSITMSTTTTIPRAPKLLLKKCHPASPLSPANPIIIIISSTKISNKAAMASQPFYKK